VRDGRRRMLWAVVAAVALGFAFGWFARIWATPTPESRAHHLLDHMRDRAREIVR
jgi:hypothetical protein